MPGNSQMRLGPFTLDRARATLRGPDGTVDLRRKSFDVLCYLAARPDQIVSKEELLEAVWPDVVVGDDSPAQCISEIRQALGLAGRSIIKTVPRRGYLLALPPDAGARSAASGAAAMTDPATRPSVAVLPFATFGEEAGQEYFSDGMTEDIITELSRFSELLVIARNSSFRYKGKAIDVRRVGRDLGAEYVLEGSVRRGADTVRITAQLVDARSRAHLWAERYDRKLDDALAVQNEVACAIVAVLAVQVHKVEKERALLKPPSVWQAYDCYLRAAENVAAYHSSYDKQRLLDARRLVDQALLIDPTYARALALLSSIHMSFWIHRWDDDAPWSAALDRCTEAARESVRLAPDLPEAHIALGQALTFLRQHDAAVAAVERALTLNPNMTSFRFSYILVLAGKAERAVQLLELHKRLDPFHQPNAPVALAYAYYMLGQYEDALPPLLAAVARAPNMAHCRYVLAMTYAQLGRLEEAKGEVARALRLEPWYRIGNSLTAAYFKDPKDREHLVEGLRKAGFPE